MFFTNRAPPILVTGCSRSGTTWVGKTLALNPRIQYLYEPFNLDMGTAGIGFPHQFMYLCRDNEHLYLDAIQDVITGPQRLPLGLKLGFHRPARLLMKDPLAFFSADWLGQTFGTRVVIIIRHPAAVASSRYQLGWRFNFAHFLDQPLLMRDYLAPFRAEMESLMGRDRDVIDESILLWKMIHQVVMRYREDHRDWIFLRHEDLCRDPLGQFQGVFGRLGLGCDRAIQTQIHNSTSQDNIIEPSQATQHSLARDSRGLAQVWKSRLSSQQIEHIRLGVAPIADQFYGSEDW